MELRHEQKPDKNPRTANASGWPVLSTAKRHLLERHLLGTAPQKHADPILPRAAGSKVLLSAEQRCVWIHASQQPDVPLYNEPVTIFRHGPLDLPTLQASVNEILRRHEAWRTSFTAEGEPVIHASARVSIPLIDLTHLPAVEREPEALRIANEDLRDPIPFDVAPLLRAKLVRLKEDEYRLQLTIHHIIFDGTSISRVFLPELAAIYGAFEQGNPSPLAPLSIQYADYALWRERHLQSEPVKRHLAYWLNQLSGELPFLELPQDRPLPAIRTHRGGTEYFDVRDKVLARLRRLCRDRGVTLFMALLAVYKLLLFRYSGQNDLIVGTIADGHRRPELETLMGYFLDTFAIRTRPTDDMRFTDYLAQTREAILAGLAAADAPFDRVVQEIRPRRDPRHHPIFQAFFSLRPSHPQLPEGWDLSTIDVPIATSKFILNLEFCEHREHLQGRFLYSTEIWDASTIRRMAAHWQVLLESVCQNPEIPLGEVALLTPEEEAALSGNGGWNDTARDFPQATLNSLFEQQVRRTPDAPAAVFADLRWTYEQLNARSDELALRLQDSGVKRGSIVAVALERSLDLLAGLLAILKTGAAYLPLDVLAPRERLTLQLADARPAAILTQRSLADRFSSHLCALVLVEEQRLLKTQAKQPEPPPALSIGNVEDTAYVIYTSGTTGEPKSIEISHRALVNLLTSMQVAPGFTSHDRLLAVTPISFDIAALELFLPLISGGSVEIASRDEARDPHRLAAAIKRSDCTVIQATPATWRMLLFSGWKPAPQAGSASKPLRVLCGGEALPRELANGLLATGVELWNMYGPTETTIWSLIHAVQADEMATDPVSIGRPIANTTAYILNSRQQHQPTGLVGELFLGGTGLAKGYRGLPQANAERFLTVQSVPGERLYRTGDLAVRQADSTIRVLGRTDNQVKVRGVRIELEAIEAAVVRHPEIAAAAARVFPDSTGESQLCVYVVAKNSERTPTPKILREFLRNVLPDNALPSAVIPLPAIPLTPHGKIDRSKLPAPTHVQARPVPASARSTEQQRLASIWSELLDRKQIGIDDNFFDLGGHSLLIAALQQRVAAEFGRAVPVVELFYHPTIREQAQFVQPLSTRLLAAWPPGVAALQPEGNQPPIFWVHYLNDKLAHSFGDERPFCVVTLTRDDIADLQPSATLENIAALHIQKIRATQAHGPYAIGGQCVGGVLAYEIAQQLKAAGEAVSLVALLDVPNPASGKPADSVITWVNYLRYLSERTIRLGPAKSYTFVRELLWNDLTRALNFGSARTEMRVAQAKIERAAKVYRPQPYDGDVLLVLSAHRPPHRDFLTGWQKVIPRSLHTYQVEAHHRDLLDVEHLPGIANAITRFIVEPHGHSGSM